MATLNFTFSVKKISDSVTPQIKRIERATGDGGRRDVLLAVANRFKLMAQSTFGANKTTYRGNTWARYSPSYAKKVGSFTPTLFRTGKLKSSIHLNPPSGNTVSVVSDMKYSAAQFMGRKNMPPRRFFPVEGKGTAWRLTARADKDLMLEMLAGFYKLSNNTLPKIGGISSRMSYSAGNPLA